MICPFFLKSSLVMLTKLFQWTSFEISSTSEFVGRVRKIRSSNKNQREESVLLVI
jgi:hypothetical protein